MKLILVTQTAQVTKMKIDTLLPQAKMLLHSKGMNWVKRQPRNCEKLFAICMSNKMTIYKIYQKSSNMKTAQLKHGWRIWTDISLKTSSQQGGCSSLLIIRQGQIKARMRHLTPVKKVIIKKIAEINTWRKGNLCTL